MPLRIARPQTQETPFRRKRAPPPQATKLLLYSLSAGLVFMAVLAIVFVPRYLENLNQPAVEIIRLQDQGGGRLVVQATAFALPLSDFNATLSRDNTTIAELGPGLNGTTAALSFRDENGNLRLDQGDVFVVTVSAQGSYRLQVWQRDVGRVVGLYAWSGVLA